MAAKTWKIEKDLCRCCHAEGAFDNLAEPRIFLEKEEIYSDMLRECLDIDVSILSPANLIFSFMASYIYLLRRNR